MVKSTKISIGNSHGYVLNDYQEKYQIIRYLYDKLEMKNLSYKFIDSEKDLYKLKNNKYYVLPHFSENKYLLVFINIREFDYCVLINKDYLESKINDININNIKIISIKMRVNIKTYLGTILDGTLINNDNKNMFVIDNIYYLKGEDMQNQKFLSKSKTMNEYINKYMIDDFNMNSIIRPILNKYFNYDQLNELVYDKMKTSKFPINGIKFVSELGGKSYVYTHIQNKQYEKIIGTFLVKKTNIVDVYDLYVDTPKNLIRYNIADVPNIKCSRYCQEIFKEKSECIMDCYYSYKTRRWIPEIISRQKTPDDYKNIKEKLKKIVL